MRGGVARAPVSAAYLRVHRRHGQLHMAEHLLDAAHVRATIEQVRCERVAQSVRRARFSLE
jgi:hypothetical protein